MGLARHYNPIVYRISSNIIITLRKDRKQNIVHIVVALMALVGVKKFITIKRLTFQIVEPF